MSTRIDHPFEPVYDERSRVLILGSFPSVKSRENDFYYGHPRNRFWKVLGVLCGEPAPETVAEKKAFLLRNGIAVFDVIRSCEITGSSDSSIRHAVATDVRPILQESKIGERIYANGKKAEELYMKLIYPQVKIPCIYLPSTSPANASCTEEKLVEEWEKILD